MGGGARPPVAHLSDGIHDAVRSDLAAIVVIERASFGDPWSRAMFTRYLDDTAHYVFVVTALANRVAGYALAQCVADEAELLNIAVDPGLRSRGVGGALLDAVMVRTRQAGAGEMWLDVRASNGSARELYRARGFGEMAVRKRYYESPREDGIVLRADLRAGSPAGRNDRVMETDQGLMPASVERILSRASHLPRQETK